MQAMWWETVVGRTSGPWLLTLRARSHTIQPDWRGLLVRQEGSATLIRAEGENANSQPTAHWIETHLTKNSLVTQTSASFPSSHDQTAITQLCITHQGHWWCGCRSEPAAGWWAALDDPPHGNTAGNPGQPQILPRFASVQQWKCS